MNYKNRSSQHSDLMMEGGLDDEGDGMGGYAGQASLNNSGTAARSGKARAARGAQHQFGYQRPQAEPSRESESSLSNLIRQSR